VEHSYIKFGDPRCVGFLRHRTENQTNTQTNDGKYPIPMTAICFRYKVVPIINNCSVIIHWTCANEADTRLTLTDRVWPMKVLSGKARSVDHSFAVWSNEQLANIGDAGLKKHTLTVGQ